MLYSSSNLKFDLLPAASLCIARMGDSDYIVNSILCFVNSAHADYPFDTLSEVAYSFYSHEEIKVAKEQLCILLKKDLVMRRDPDKKKKDLKDLLDMHQELIASRKKVNFVTNTYKKMPPVGMAVFAPILSHLSDEIGKINEVLPKILDIKTEVCNTADTVRQMKVDIVDIREKFRIAVCGMEEASRNMAEAELDVMEELQSFRNSVGPNDVFDLIEHGRKEANDPVNTKSYADFVKVPKGNARDGGIISASSGQSTDIDNVVRDARTGAISKSISKTSARSKKNDDGMKRRQSHEGNKKDSSVSLVDGSASARNKEWTLVKSRNTIRRDRLPNNRSEKKVTGSKKTEGGLLKAAVVTADVFVGRVDIDVTAESVASYVKDNFAVEPIHVFKMDIRSDQYAAFKINVRMSDRDKLFDENLWPQDIIVKKFYNRRRRNNSDGNNGAVDDSVDKCNGEGITSRNQREFV